MARPPIFESYSSELPAPGSEGPGVSKPAVFGFAFSLMFCLPVLSGLAGVILGVVGLLQIRAKRAIGRPVAIAAIVIGTISIVLWGLMIGGVAVGVAYVVEIEKRSVEFIEAVANGEMERARGYVSQTVPDEKLQEWAAALVEPGTEADAMIWNFSAGDMDTFDVKDVFSGPYYMTGHVQYRLKSAGEERPRSRQVWLSLAREAGTFRVLDMTIKEAPTTLPIPEEFFEAMKEIEKFEQLRRVRPPDPATRPAAVVGEE